MLPDHIQWRISSVFLTLMCALALVPGGDCPVVMGQEVVVLPQSAMPSAAFTPEGSARLAEFQARADLADGRMRNSSLVVDPNIVAELDTVWWSPWVLAPLELSDRLQTVGIEALAADALVYSPHLQAAAAEPHIELTHVFEESATFDWRSFLETQYQNLNDPVGNTLTTGNNDSRLRQHEWYASGGVRKRTVQGGEIELSQRMGRLTNNSNFLVPKNQGNARLELNVRQPLMRGAGRPVNQSLVLLAQVDFAVASDDYANVLQSHLVQVAEAYWELVRARAVLCQRRKLLQSAQEVLATLEGRQSFDSQMRQILRARAAVVSRQALIVRAEAQIRNAESTLRLLVNSPPLIEAAGAEFIPVDTPVVTPLEISLSDALTTALTHRPDVSKALRQLRQGQIEMGLAQNQSLPRLDLLLGMYVAGLDGQRDTFGAWSKQFRDGDPGFNVGLEFELPRGNRAARARLQRRHLEMTQAFHEFRATVEAAMTEVEIKARDLETTFGEMVGRYMAMQAAREEAEFLLDRWRMLADENDAVVLLLEDLLDAQERLAEQESALAQAQSDYALAIVRLQQATGRLLQINRL